MVDTEAASGDATLQALTSLSGVVEAITADLTAVGDELGEMRRRRGSGWSWRRILASVDEMNALTTMSKVVIDLGVASGQFRRTLSRALRSEGMQITEIAAIYQVSRQRVSTLMRSKGEGERLGSKGEGERLGSKGEGERLGG